jgi:hypothetical protein
MVATAGSWVMTGGGNQGRSEEKIFNWSERSNPELRELTRVAYRRQRELFATGPR